MNLRYIDLDENLLTRGSDGTYYRLRIGQDDWIDSPRDWSPLGHMLCWNRRYNLGDKHDYSEPIDFWHDMVREHIDRNTLFAYALSGDGSVRLQKEIDEDGEESYELCYWGYISFLGDKQKASWCIDKTYDTGDIEDLRSGGWYVEDDIIEDLGFLCLREDGTCLHDISFHRNELDGIEFDNFVYDGCRIEEYIQFWRLSCIDGDVELKRVYLTKQWRTRVQNEQMDQCK